MILELHRISLPLAAFPLEIHTSLRPGITGLTGPSGAGKTTLLEIIAGLRRPASGRLSLHGQVLSDSATGRFVPPARRRIGYVPQDQALFPHWTALQNLEASARLTRCPADPALRETLVSLLELQPLLARPVHQLSGGEKARLALGRALLSRPALLLLDEPLAHLDDRLRDRALDYLKQIPGALGLPLLIVSHSARELGALGADILSMERGRIPGDPSA